MPFTTLRHQLYRERRPADTLVEAKRLTDRVGISRVTDITRMDRLGLPVFASVRPRGQVLRVHAGKGLTVLDAEVGAYMEAIEFAAAELDATRDRLHEQSLKQVQRQFLDLRIVDFAPVVGRVVDPTAPILVVPCEDIQTQQVVFLPAELIFVPFEAGPRGIFGWGTNGLASGNSVDEATLHALLEILERDAISMNRVRDGSQWLDPTDLPYPFAGLVQEWLSLGFRISVRYVPNVFSLPCFEATIDDSAAAGVRASGGAGLHLDREVALGRAICEAAQSRLSLIQGAREDITGYFDHDRDLGQRQDRRVVDARFEPVRRVAYARLPDHRPSTKSVPQMLQSLTNELARRGFKQVYRYCFDRDLGDISVVKLVVPKCENIRHDSNRIGPRLLAKILQDA